MSAYEEARRTREQLASRFPGDAMREFDLAHTSRDLVALFRAQKKYAAAEQMSRRAEAILTKLTRDYPGVPAYHSALGGTYQNLGLVYREMGQPAEALALFEKAAACQRRALEADGKNYAYRQILCSHCYQIADLHLHEGNHEPAARAAAEMGRFWGGRGMDLYAAAGLLARCAASAEGDVRLPAARRTELAREYDKEARRILDQINPDPARRIPPRDIRAFPELAPLRRYEEFKQVLGPDTAAPGK